MRRLDLRRLLSSASLTFALALCASPDVRAQQTEAGESKRPARDAAEKFDEYGSIGHCDLTARLDNLAVELQNDRRLKAYLVSYDAAEKTGEHANHSLSTSRHYLINQRGVEPERVFVVNGGRKEGVERVLNELWVVPEGAPPPFDAPEKDKYSDAQFSGKFDTYSTDDSIYAQVVEMGWTMEGMARHEFAEKLKQQPESVGYLVVRPSKTAAPGAFRRVARRDEAMLANDYGIGAGRLKSIYGGESEGEYTSVELWVLPKSAPPPAGVPEPTAERRDPSAHATAFRLNVHDDYSEANENAERWILENLVEALRADPRAVAHFIVRESKKYDDAEDASETSTAESSTAEPVATDSAVMDEAAASQESSEAQAGTEKSAADAEPEEAATEATMLETAERWKRTLVEKYGVEARRVLIMEGRPRGWGSGRLTTWVVPEKALAPDPFARDDDDEPEEEETQATEEAATDVAPPETPPSPRR
jgi:hypothetical protein